MRCGSHDEGAPLASALGLERLDQAALVPELHVAPVADAVRLADGLGVVLALELAADLDAAPLGVVPEDVQPVFAHLTRSHPRAGRNGRRATRPSQGTGGAGAGAFRAG